MTSAQHRAYDAFWRDTSLDAVTPIHIELAPRLTGPVVVDLGCGTGQLAGLRRDLGWLGVDGSEGALRLARPRLTASVVGDLHGAVPIGSGRVHEAVCIDVLEHLTDPRPLLQELARVLSPQGRAWLATPNAQYVKHLLTLARGRMFTTSDARTLFRGGHLQDFTMTDVLELASECGLRVHQVLPVYASRFAAWQRRVVPPRAVLRFVATGFLYELGRNCTSEPRC